MVEQPILVVGSLNMDQIVQVERLPMMGETLLGAGSLQLVSGGKGANQAVAAARLGAHVALAGRVGRDPFGDQLLSSLQTDGVDTSLVVVDEEAASGVAFIFLSPQGENAIVVASGANARVGKDRTQMEQVQTTLTNSSALMLQLETPLETVTALIAAGHKAGIPVILNLAPAYPLPLTSLRQLEVLVVNETEAAFLGETLVDRSLLSTNTSTLEQSRLLAIQLHEQGIHTVIITLGARGALLARTDENNRIECLHQEPPQVQIVDTTAAGDCFTAAFTVALIEGQLPAEALRFAVYASALKVTKFGAQAGLPGRPEVEALLHSD